ncbi:MAG: 2'-5' RNA ligase family protein [Spirochaetales bacterium]
MRFIVITVPPEAQRAPLEAFRQTWNRNLGTFEALRYPAHLTLRTGLVCPDDQAESVAERFLEHARKGQPCSVATDGLFFVTYGEPRRGMAGWRVPLSAGLERVHRHLLEFSAWQKGPQAPFEPHVSLAYHDLTPEQLLVLERQLAGVDVPSAQWTLDHVALFREVDGVWVEWARTVLRGA